MIWAILLDVHPLLTQKRFTIGLTGSVLLNGATWILLYWMIPQTDLSVVLHHNIYFGVDLVGEWYKLFYIPLSGSIIILLNTGLSFIVYTREKLLSSVIEMSSLVIQAALLIAAGVAVYMNLA